MKGTDRTVACCAGFDSAYGRGQLTRELLLLEAEKKTALFVTHGVDEAVFMGLSISRAKLQPLEL